MGMTDRQFDVYQENLLNQLKLVQEQLAEKGEENKMLNIIIQTIENALKRP